MLVLGNKHQPTTLLLWKDRLLHKCVNITVFQECKRRDFTMVQVVKNRPSRVGNVDFIPGWGTKTPYAAGQLSWSMATTEPMPWSLCTAAREACVPQWKVPCAATEAWCSPINKYFKKECKWKRTHTLMMSSLTNPVHFVTFSSPLLLFSVLVAMKMGCSNLLLRGPSFTHGPGWCPVEAPPSVTPYLLAWSLHPVVEHRRGADLGPRMREGDSSDGQLRLEDLPSTWPKLSWNVLLSETLHNPPSSSPPHLTHAAVWSFSLPSPALHFVPHRHLLKSWLGVHFSAGIA